MILPPDIEAELDALARECIADASAMQSPWEPAVVAAAFATGAADPLFSFTMQVWIDLDAMRAPLLGGGECATAEDFTATLAAFGHDPVEFDAEEAVAIMERMERVVAAGFATRLGMRQAQTETGEAVENGFGEWLQVLAFLVAECGMSRAEALGCPVGQAFALCAARRHLQGWLVAGTPYAGRTKEAARG